MRLLLPSDVPVELGRDAARDAARAELAEPAYAEGRPGVVERLFEALRERLQDVLLRAAEASPGGALGLLVLALLAVAAGVALRRRYGPVQRAAWAGTALFPDRARSSAEHAAAADEHAGAGRWAEAVRDRVRSIVRGLEERELLDARAARTAGEAAAEAGAVLPDRAEDLREAARLFDEVWYGGRAASAATDARLRGIAARVAAARPVPVPVPDPGPDPVPVPVERVPR